MKRIGIKLYNEGIMDILRAFSESEGLIRYRAISYTADVLKGLRKERSYKKGITDFLMNIKNNPVYYPELIELGNKLMGRYEKDRA